MVASQRFLTEVRRSHHVVSYVDVVSPTNEVQRLTATGGNVQEDATADVRRRCSITCVDATGDLTPRGAEDLLTPYGTELRPYRGVRYDDGTEELMPLGVFRISQSDVDDSVGGSPDIRIEAFDRSRTIQRNKFVEPYVIEEGTNVVEAIKALVQRTFVDAEFDAISSTITTSGPTVFDTNTDPWQAIQTLAKSIGCEAFYDANGLFVIAPPVDIDAMPSPDFTFIEGHGCTMTNIATKFTDEAFNGIVLTGESVGDEEEPVRAVVWDDEPTSPTYHLGPFGEHPEFITDQNVKTEAEAENAARALLQERLGATSQVSITAWPNPALYVGGVVEVRRERSGIDGLYVVDAVTTPLDAKTAGSYTVRQRRATG